MQRIFLSDTNENYRLLEEFLSEGEFGEMPDYESNKAQLDPLNYDLTMSIIQNLNPGLFNSYSDSELTDLKKTLTGVVLPTRYDSVAAFNLLNELVDDVKQAAVHLGLNIDLFPLHATVPIGEVNAMAVNLPGASKPFLLFDGQLMTFCHLISKIYATSFVGKKNGDTGSYSTDISTIKKRLSTHPVIVERLAGVLTAYIRTGRPGTSKPFAVDQESIGLSNCLRKSMELFIVAHEFGHVYAGHLSNLPMHAIPQDSSIPWEHRKEYQADYIGLLLTLIVLGKEGYDTAVSIMGIKLFFSILDLTDRYSKFIELGAKKSVSTTTHSHPSNEQRSIAIDMGLTALQIPSEQITNSKKLSEVFDGITSLFWQALIRPKKKTGRNDKCLCESGLKYKSCCMR
jgi:hypothetical protein